MEAMKAILYVVAALILVVPARAQEHGHYDLISVNEAIQGDKYTVSVMAWERQKIEVTIDKPAYVSLEISLRTTDGQLLTSERPNRLDQRYRRVLNLSRLETGRYWLDIQIGKERLRRELRVEATEQSYQVLTLSNP